MDPTANPHDARNDGRSRRTILQALAASGSVAAIGGIATAQEDDETAGGTDETDETDDTDEIPVAGEFPAGETVGLRRVAMGVPAPTDFDYVEVDGEVYHVVVTQTGQVFFTDIHDQPDAAETADADPDDTDTDGADDAEAEDTDTDDLEAEDDDESDDLEGAAEDDEPVGTDEEDDGEPEEYVFNGVIPGWIGMEPSDIERRENPTLELTPGETYRITWENGDGQPHNVVILDAAGNVLEQTEIVREQGETQTLEFEATEEMNRYLCEVHPDTMVGRLQVEDEAAEDEEPADAEEPAGDADVQTPDDMTLVLDIRDRLVNLGIGELGGYDERGLLGIAFHPDFAENRRFYVRYSAPEREGLGYNHTDVLAEFQADEDLTGVDPETERTIMEVQQPQDNHNGGRLAFGPDGYLYTSYGDGGNVHDIGIGHVDDWYAENEGGNAQDTTENPLGGIHRIDVDAEDDQVFGEYGVPDDNPLVDSEADIASYWAWGFRNPWGMSIDDDGQVFVSDAGQHRVESVYAVREGGNHSWNVKEGSFCFSTDSPLESPADCPDEVPEDAAVSDARAGEQLLDPIAEYQHTRISEAFIDSSVVVGGHRYAGEAVPELEGAFVFGNWSSQGVAEADGEVLAAIEPDGAEAAGEAETDDSLDDEEADADDAQPDDADDGDDLVGVDRWDLGELQFEGADDESLNRYVYSVERDEEGELYVLVNTDYRPNPETGEIYKIVPADEGEDVPAPEDPVTVDPEGAREQEAAEADDEDGDDAAEEQESTEGDEGDADADGIDS